MKILTQLQWLAREGYTLNDYNKLQQRYIKNKYLEYYNKSYEGRFKWDIQIVKIK